MMEKIIITPENAGNHAWIWDFLEQQRQSGQFIWQTNQNFTYNGNSFQFKQPLFARERKNNNGFAYEMTSREFLGAGAFGSVYRISRTLSNGKNGIFQVQDKKRIVKFQNETDTQHEYKIAQYAEHLHVKKPILGRIVMKEMAGKTLNSFLHTQRLSREERLELTKEFLRTYKTQVADKGLRHNDLHPGNILIQIGSEPSPKKYNINIIDFGLARKSFLSNYYSELYTVIDCLWRDRRGTPQIIKHILNMDFRVLVDYIDLFDYVMIAPTEEAQKPLDDLFIHFQKLSNAYPKLASKLKEIMKEGVQQSNAQDMEPMKKAVLKCKAILITDNPHKKFLPVFDVNPKKQNAFNEIFNYFQALENKGTALKRKSQNKEGEMLCNLVAELREQTFQAAYLPDNEQSTALRACGETCKKLLATNQELLDIHQNNHYIWAEIGAIFCSLIVLYPIAAGINYLLTGRLGFFNQTNSAAGAEQMEKHFNTLNPITVK